MACVNRMAWWPGVSWMLRQRVITALIMAGLFLAGIMFLPLPALAAAFGLVVAAGAWEWSRLAGWQSPVTRGVYVLIVLAARAGDTHAAAVARSG